MGMMAEATRAGRLATREPVIGEVMWRHMPEPGTLPPLSRGFLIRQH